VISPPEKIKPVTLRPLRLIPWWAAALGPVVVAASVVATTLWLFPIAGRNASLRIEAIKVGLSVGAGIGAGIALLLAFRRQWLNERTQAHAEDVARESAYDATQRRITELYAKAVEQLGHDKATVRLGGLYSLERLAQDQPEHRQAVVDVVCAYLRMPFRPAALPITGGAAIFTDLEAANELCETILDPTGASSELDQEFQVRIAAQKLLARHFSASRYQTSKTAHFPKAYWPEISIDLTGTILIHLDFAACRLDYSDFRGARFLGTTIFNSAEFISEAKFEHAIFAGSASFYDVIFHSYTGFSDAKFSQPPDLRQAQTAYPSKHVWPDGWSVKQFGPNRQMGQLVEHGTEPSAGPEIFI
jgi:Pentapeptide repeats (9 copies)